MRNLILTFILLLNFTANAQAMTLAEYIYLRVKFYQSIEDYRMRTLIFWEIYEELEKL